MPGVVLFYKCYCWALFSVNLALFLVCIWFILKHSELANEVVSSQIILGTGFLGGIFSFILVVLNVLTAIRKFDSKSWPIGIANIITGFVTIVLAPVSLVLLLLWFRPEIRAYFDSLERA